MCDCGFGVCIPTERLKQVEYTPVVFCRRAPRGDCMIVLLPAQLARQQLANSPQPDPRFRSCHVVHSQHKSGGATLHSVVRYANLRVDAKTNRSICHAKQKVPRYNCDSNGWNTTMRHCNLGGFSNYHHITFMYNGYVLSMADLLAFQRSRCTWISGFREPISRLVSAYHYCRIPPTGASPHSDPLCGSEFLDARNATIQQWAAHWGNYLLRDLLLYPSLGRAALPDPLPSWPSEPPFPTALQNGGLWYRIKQVLGDGGEAHTPSGKQNVRNAINALRDGALYDVFIVLERKAESSHLLDLVLPLTGGSTWRTRLEGSGITHRVTASSVTSERDATLAVAQQDPEVRRHLAADLQIYHEGVLPTFDKLLQHWARRKNGHLPP